MVLYTALFSVLAISIVQLIFSMNIKNSKLNDKLNEQYNPALREKGFSSIWLVSILSFVTLISVISTSGSVYSYVDSVTRREIRTQIDINIMSCIDRAKIMLYSDPFLEGPLSINELGCDIEIDKYTNNRYSLNISGHIGNVRAYRTAQIEI